MMPNFLETPIGTVEINPTEATHLYCVGEVTVRGKTMKGSLHFYRWSNGEWNLGMEKDNTYQRIRSSFEFGSHFDRCTEAFQKKVLETFIPAVRNWIEDHPEVLAKVIKEHQEKAVKARQKLIALHQRAMQRLQGEIDRITNGEDLPISSDIVLDKWGDSLS